VYQLADFLRIRAVQVIVFERFETVFPHTRPIVIPSTPFIKELSKEASPVALRVYVARHSAYWILQAAKKANKWTALVESEPGYGMDTAKWMTKLLPLLQTDPENFKLQHPAYSRGGFALKYGLNLKTPRAEANERVMNARAADRDAMRP
jgi:hypothetical protein